jgi:hypothetical protein
MVTRSGRIIRFTAVNDFWPGRVWGYHIRFVGKGLTLGELLQLVDNNGTPIADHYVVNQIEDQPILDTGLRIMMNGIKVAALPTGTAEVLVYLE